MNGKAEMLESSNLSGRSNSWGANYDITHTSMRLLLPV